MTGKTILQYKVGEKLGSGGMGEVYRGEDTRLGRQVALKFLPAANRADPERRQRLFQEARAASLLRSAHIAVTYDIIEQDDALFIVMEYVEGEVLSKKLERGPLGVRESVDIAFQTCDALDDAHSRGIIHRDIKSSNLILDTRGLVKVLDFGIAKFLRTADGGDATRTFAEITRPGEVLGTVSYMSPEQALGRRLDHRSDIFSLGVLTYQMVTGQLPFVGESTNEIIDRIIHHEPSPAVLLNPEVPGELSLLIQRAMEKEVQYRWPSAREMRERLRRVQRQIEAEGLSYEDDPPGSLTTAMAGAGHGVPGSSRTPGRVDSIAVITFLNITREPADDWIGLGIAETVTADLQSVHGLSIVGRARIFESLKDLSSAALDIRDEKAAMSVGRRLGARWVVGGAYQRIGPQIRITAQIFDVRTGGLARTLKVDGQVADIFRLQDRIVYELAQGLNLSLNRTEIDAIERNETRSVEAYECYARGMLNLRSASRESLDRALHYFDRALELDPDYAAAWSSLGVAYMLKGSFLGLRELSERAIHCLRRAIAIKPTLASAHSGLSSAFNNLGQYDDAIAAAREAVRLDARDAVAHHALARVYWVGKGMIKEGMAALEKTVELNPESGHAYLQLGFLYALERDFERAEAASRKAIDLQERFISGSEGLKMVGGHARLGYVYYLQGRLDDAIREYESEMAFLASSDHALRERTQIEIHEKLGAAHLRQGHQAEAVRHLESAVKAYESRLARGSDDPFTKYYVACACALLGDADRALKLLEESSQTLGALNRRRLAVDPDLESLKEHPAFGKLLGKG